MLHVRTQRRPLLAPSSSLRVMRGGDRPFSGRPETARVDPRLDRLSALRPLEARRGYEVGYAEGAEMTQIRVPIPGTPRPFSRRRSGEPSDNYSLWREVAAGEVARAVADYRRTHRLRFPLDGPLLVELEVAPGLVEVGVHFDRDDVPGRPRGLKGDLDNYGKAVLDALEEGGVILNDKQVHSLEMRFRG